MKKVLLVIIFVIFTLNCFAITIFLKDNNQLTGEIKKIDKQKIYVSPCYSKVLFIVKKIDVQTIMDGEIDLTVNILTKASQGKINYNSYLEINNIELDETENAGNIDYSSKLIVNDDASIKKTKKNSTFDDKRKGFIIGFGIGGNSTSFKQEFEYDGEVSKSGTVNKTGLATDFRIGYSPQNTIEIYYVSKVSWFTIKNTYNDNVIISDGVGALGFSYFFSKKLNSAEWVSSPYFGLGFGFSAWSTPFEEGSSSSIGIGLFASFGYEFNKHRRFEFSFFKNNPSDEAGGAKLTTDSMVFMLTYNYLWF